MVKLTWYSGNPPDNIKIQQVYGVAFDNHGRILVRIDKTTGKNDYNLAGGKPEVYDKTMIDTLRREFIEEVNTTLTDQIKLIGYQTVEYDNNLPMYAQVRMACVIKNVGIKKPDPDNGKTYDRILCSPSKAINLLSWGDIGEKLITEATEIMKTHFGIIYDGSDEEYV